jgi:hypothetical protein
MNPPDPARRPGKQQPLDDSQKTLIGQLLAGGASLSAAAGAAGLTAKTILRLSRADRQLADDLSRAGSQFELYLLRTMRKAAENDWRACAWLLDRAAPAADKAKGGVRRENVRRLLSGVERIVRQAIAEESLRKSTCRQIRELALHLALAPAPRETAR